MTKIIEFKLNSQPVRTLMDKDSILAGLISYIGDYTLLLRTEYFGSLVKSIIGQQLSAKAASSIWLRVQTICPDISPLTLNMLNDGQLRGVGVSSTKIRYLRDLTQRVLSKDLNLDTIENLTNDEVISTLTQVKGIGRWTAEMFMIFSLGRQDILALDDVGLQRAVKWLYQLGDISNSADLLAYGELWKPSRTIASLYLWEVINQGLVKVDPCEILSYSQRKDCLL